MQDAYVDALKNGQGYTKVAMRSVNHRSALGMWFMAMADTCCAEGMNDAINEHLITARARISKISDKEFKGLKGGVESTLDQGPRDLSEENERLWQEFESQQMMWDRTERSKEALEEVTREEFVGHFESLFFSESTRRLDIEFVSQQHAAEQATYYDKNESTHMFSEVTKRVKLEGGADAFKNQVAFYDDQVKIAYQSRQ